MKQSATLTCKTRGWPTDVQKHPHCTVLVERRILRKERGKKKETVKNKYNLSNDACRRESCNKQTGFETRHITSIIF